MFQISSRSAVHGSDLEFKKFMKFHVHVFNNIGEFIDQFHYKPGQYDDFNIYEEIKEAVFLDIDPKCLPDDINDFKFCEDECHPSMSNVIKNGYLHSLCKRWLDNEFMEEHGIRWKEEDDKNKCHENGQNELLVNIYYVIKSES